ncbi:GlcG/HbpS family heme-binding protein [Blastococcus sp. SYSU D00820]
MQAEPPLDRVRAAVDAALAEAARSGLGVSLAVVDGLGHDLVVVRGDGAAWFTAGIARSKARTAVAFGRPSADVSGLREAYPDVFDLAAEQLPFRPTTLPGGLPIVIGGRPVAAVGVSGATPEEDLRCAGVARDALGG